MFYHGFPLSTHCQKTHITEHDSLNCINIASNRETLRNFFCRLEVARGTSQQHHLAVTLLKKGRQCSNLLPEEIHCIMGEVPASPLNSRSAGHRNICLQAFEFNPWGHWGIGLVVGQKVVILGKKLRVPFIIVLFLLVDRLQRVCQAPLLAQ